MRYFFKSVKTLSYWKYAVFSPGGARHFFQAVGVIWLFMELLEFFSVYTKDRYGAFAFPMVLILAFAYTLFSRRPLSRFQYKIPRRDFCIEVGIGDIFDMSGEIVVSTNTTFDTDISNGIIASNSLQGQFLLKFYQGNVAELDKQITRSLDEQIMRSLDGWSIITDESRKGKKKVFPIGAIAKVPTHGKNFYFLAMAELNEHGNAYSTPQMIDEALYRLWKFMASRGELGDIVVPVLGTGRGRVNIPRKKMIERIAQSFADASTDRVFARKLSIVIYPGDAENFGVNLFEIRDYMVHSLHI
jgi:hypothetical protein